MHSVVWEDPPKKSSVTYHRGINKYQKHNGFVVEPMFKLLAPPVTKNLERNHLLQYRKTLTLHECVEGARG